MKGKFLSVIMCLLLIVTTYAYTDSSGKVTHGVVINIPSSVTTNVNNATVVMINASIYNIISNTTGEAALPGTCPWGSVVMNTTNNSFSVPPGVQCVPVVDLETDPVWNAVESLYAHFTDLVAIASNLSFEQSARIGNDTEIRQDVNNINNTMLGINTNLSYEVSARIGNETLFVKKSGDNIPGMLNYTNSTGLIRLYTFWNDTSDCFQMNVANRDSSLHIC